MTPQQMGRRARWALDFYPKEVSGNISVAWLSLEEAVTCFYNASLNPLLYRFHPCLAPLDVARQCIEHLRVVIYTGPESPHVYDELNLLIKESNVVITFYNSIADTLREGFSNLTDTLDGIQDHVEKRRVLPRALILTSHLLPALNM